MDLIVVSIGYLVVINVVTFLIYGIDKYKAKRNRCRISEANLLLLAAMGGSIGALLAMRVFHHKTLHKHFSIGVPTMLVLQILITLWILWQF